MGNPVYVVGSGSIFSISFGPIVADIADIRRHRPDADLARVRLHHRGCSLWRLAHPAHLDPETGRRRGYARPSNDNTAITDAAEIELTAERLSGELMAAQAGPNGV